jgi:hypothetical protein
MLKQVLATISEGLSLPDTDDPEIAFKRAQASLARNDWATAIGHLSRAVKLKPLDVTFNLALSLTLFLFGEILASKESFAKTIILDEKKSSLQNLKIFLILKQNFLVLRRLLSLAFFTAPMRRRDRSLCLPL